MTFRGLHVAYSTFETDLGTVSGWVPISPLPTLYQYFEIRKKKKKKKLKHTHKPSQNGNTRQIDMGSGGHPEIQVLLA